MTTGTLPEPIARPLAHWAARQLGLPPDVSPADARARFLERVAAEDFMPPWKSQQAYRVLAGLAPSPALTGQALADEEECLRDEVEAFAGEFLRLDRNSRQARWRELRDRATFSPPLTACLQELQPALPLGEPSVPDDPAVEELIRQVCALFVLRPAARAVRRQQWLASLGPDDLARMIRAAARLELAYAEIAALEPVVVRQLTTWSQRARTRQRIRRERQGAEEGSSSNALKPVLIGVIILISFLAKVLSGSRTTGGSSPPPVVPPFTMPRAAGDTQPMFEKLALQALWNKGQRGSQPCFAADGKTALYTSTAGSMKLCALTSDRSAQEWNPNNREPRWGFFAADGSTPQALVYSSSKQAMVIVDAATDTVVRTLEGTVPHRPVLHSPDGIIVLARHGSARTSLTDVWRLPEGQWLGQFAAKTTRGKDMLAEGGGTREWTRTERLIAVSPDGKKAAWASVTNFTTNGPEPQQTQQRHLHLRDPETNREWHQLACNTELAVFSTNSASIAVVDDKEILLFDWASREQHWNYRVEKKLAGPIAFSPTGQLIVASDGHEIYVWDAASGKQYGKLKSSHQYPIDYLVIAPNGKRLISSSLDKTLLFKLYDD